MNIYWCNNCNVPVLHSENEEATKAKSNPYFDIEGELIEWLFSIYNSTKYFNLYISYKHKINSSIDNGSLEAIYSELESETKHDAINTVKRFALRYLDNKVNEVNIVQDVKDSKCPRCGSSTNYIGKDVRPVFLKERILLSIFFEDPNLVFKSIWNTGGNRYVINGEIEYVKSKKLYNREDINKADINKKAEEILKMNSDLIDMASRDINFEKFIEVNKEHYQFIDNQALSFIQKANKVFKNRLKVVSFSGGKDSTVVSDLVTRALGTQDVLHVFGDTTLEFESTYEYIDRIKKNAAHPPFLSVDKSEKDFFELSSIIGPPSRVMNWCCTIFKTGPIGDLFRQIAVDQDILTYYGIRRSESNSRSQYDKITKSPKISKQLVVSPIIDWLDADIWLYILTRGIDFNEAYRYGFTRVGCWCCPNNSRRSEYLSKIYLKEESQKWNRFLVDFATKIGKPDAEEYVKKGKWKARQGGQGLDTEEISLSLESNPCALEDDAKNYTLSKPISEDLYELFKPFGIINKDIGNKMLGEVYVLDVKKKIPKFVLQGNEGSRQLKVKVMQNKNIRLLFQRIECQLRKYQSCISCTACANICPYNAISLINGYKIDEEKCRHCMKCIAYYHKGCLVTKTMVDY